MLKGKLREKRDSSYVRVRMKVIQGRAGSRLFYDRSVE